MTNRLSKLAKIPVLVCGLALAVNARADDFSRPPPPPPPPPSAPAPSATPAGWDTPYALLFSLNNIFQTGSILGNFQNYGIGGQYNLKPKMAIRAGIALGRQSNPAYVSETTTIDGNSTTPSKNLVVGEYTSKSNLRVGGDVLYGLTDTALMPYVGAGLALKLSTISLSYTDDTKDGIVNTKDNGTTLFGVNLRGVLGVQWRVHRSFALFAEYALGVDLFDVASISTDESRTTTANGTSTTTSTKSEGTQTSFLVTELGLAQGGSLGLLAFF